MSTKIERAVEMLKRIDAYANSNERFAEGDMAQGYDIFGSDIDSVTGCNNPTYQTACGRALRDMTEDERDEALHMAGIDPDLVG